MTVAQLNTELKKRKVEAPLKALKKVLQKLLLTSLSTQKEKKTNDKEDEKRKKEVNNVEATAEDEEKEVEGNEEELKEMTTAQLKALMKKRGIEVPNKAVRKRVLVDLVLTNSKEEEEKKKKQKSQESQNSSWPAKAIASKRKLERFVGVRIED